MKQGELLKSARQLRRKGYSYAEISKELHISKSTASLWANDVVLDLAAQTRLKERFCLGLEASLVTQTKTRQEKIDIIRQSQSEYLSKLPVIPNRLLCALIYWCEGTKEKDHVRFTNSDPKLITTFLRLFRSLFVVDESKFRMLLHLHDYHNEDVQKKFWSEVTQIPLTQFTKTFHKANTGKVKRPGYPGCAHVKYYDAHIAKELLILAETFMV